MTMATIITMIATWTPEKKKKTIKDTKKVKNLNNETNRNDTNNRFQLLYFARQNKHEYQTKVLIINYVNELSNGHPSYVKGYFNVQNVQQQRFGWRKATPPIKTSGRSEPRGRSQKLRKTFGCKIYNLSRRTMTAGARKSCSLPRSLSNQTKPRK